MTESQARARAIEGLAEKSLNKLAENSELVSTQYTAFLQQINAKVDQLASQCLAAAKYNHQQTEIQCEQAKEEEQRLSMVIAHCRELQAEFIELKELASVVYA